MIYRYDLEGLRCIAIIFVYVYHYNKKMLSGGYIGVDIFFCLSGFIILHKYENSLSKKRDINNFYSKRIIRIFPQSYFVLFYVEYFIKQFLENNPIDILNDVRYSLIYISNYSFYKKKINYLYSSLASSPLLHFWSLSVEVHFYIICPILLNIERYGLLFLAFLSFAICIFYSIYDNSYSYFSLSTRLWEFIYGFYVTKMVYSRVNKIILIASSYIGLLQLIQLSILYNNSLNYPSFYAILPLFSITPILLYKGYSKYAVNNLLLQNKLILIIGKLSFIIYLWHYIVIKAYNDLNMCIILVILFIYTFISYKLSILTETLGKKYNLIHIVIILFGLCIYLYSYKIVTFNINTTPPLYSDYGNIMSKCYRNVCVDKNKNISRRDKFILLLGDSHLIVFMPLFKKIASILNARILFCWITKETLLLYGYNSIMNEHKGEIDMYNIHKLFLCNRIHNNSTAIQLHINKSINPLYTICNDIYFIEDVPKLQFNPYKCIINNGKNCMCILNNNCSYLQNNIIKKNNKISYISFINDICKDNKCQLLYDKIVMYVDYDHLSLEYVEHKSLKLLYNFKFVSRKKMSFRNIKVCVKYLNYSRRC